MKTKTKLKIKWKQKLASILNKNKLSCFHTIISTSLIKIAIYHSHGLRYRLSDALPDCVTINYLFIKRLVWLRYYLFIRRLAWLCYYLSTYLSNALSDCASFYSIFTRLLAWLHYYLFICIKHFGWLHCSIFYQTPCLIVLFPAYCYY